MQLPRSFARAARWVILGTTFAATASGADGACEAVAVTADRGVSLRWPDLLERVRQGLEGRDDIDHCARVHLGSSRDGLKLEVVLQDGRSAARWVPSSEDALPGLEALLLVPAVSREPSTSPEPPPSRASKRSPQAEALRATPIVKALPGRQRATLVSDAGLAPEVAGGNRRIGATLSLGGGARIGNGQVNSNVGAIALVIVSDWLAGFDARMASYEVPMTGRIPQSTLELTAVGGHRFGSGTFGLDLLLGPTLVVRQDLQVHQEQDGRVSTTRAQSVVPRLFAASRLTIGARSVLSGFVGLEGAAGPSGATSEDTAAGLPSLPVWMLGFVVGATVGVP